VSNVSECTSRADCDIFLEGICGRRIVYSDSCRQIGKEACLKLSHCAWDEASGCSVDEAKSENSSSFVWIIVVCIGMCVCV
jgi:hypothetical protein